MSRFIPRKMRKGCKTSDGGARETGKMKKSRGRFSWCACLIFLAGETNFSKRCLLKFYIRRRGKARAGWESAIHHCYIGRLSYIMIRARRAQWNIIMSIGKTQQLVSLSGAIIENQFQYSQLSRRKMIFLFIGRRGACMAFSELFANQ